MDSVFVLNGLRFGATTEHDDSMGEPWKEHDGHGVVVDWVSRNKQPHERVLAAGRGTRMYYDVKASMEIALRDGWGLSAVNLDALITKLGRVPKPGDIAAAAVDADYDRLCGWCNNDWGYVGVIVTLLDVDGRPTDERESLWGVESDAEDYLEEVALELAEQIAERIGDATTIPARPSEFVVRRAA